MIERNIQKMILKMKLSIKSNLLLRLLFSFIILVISIFDYNFQFLNLIHAYIILSFMICSIALSIIQIVRYFKTNNTKNNFVEFSIIIFSVITPIILKMSFIKYISS